MKKINKTIVLAFMWLILSSTITECFYYGDDPGANFLGTAGTATLIGGAASGNRGATYAGLGMMGAGAIMGAARNNRRRRRDRRDEDEYRYSRKKRRRLEDENADLRARLQQYEN